MDEFPFGILPTSKATLKSMNLELLLPLGLFIGHITNHYLFDFLIFFEFYDKRPINNHNKKTFQIQYYSNYSNSLSKYFRFFYKNF